MWGKKPISFGKNSKFYNDTMSSDRIRVLLNGNANKINLNNSFNFVENVLVKTLKGNEFSINAEHFIICTRRN